MKLNKYLTINKKNISFFILFILLIEMLSLLSFNFANLNYFIFFLIIALSSIAILINFSNAIYIIVFEVMINAMGYIFFLDIDGTRLSLRIALWLIMMSIFAFKLLLDYKNIKKNIQSLLESIPHFKILLIFIFLLLYSFILGLYNNGFGDTFSDFSAWLFLLSIFPFAYILNNDKANKKIVWNNLLFIFIGTSIYISLKTILFFFLFYYDFNPIISDLYAWTRFYLLGEITKMSDGFVRIFLQNQIFLIFAYFLVLIDYKNKAIGINKIFLSTLFATALLISFSRSFWLAFIVSLLLVFSILLYKQRSVKQLSKFIIKNILIISLSLLSIVLIMNIPFISLGSSQGIQGVKDRTNITNSEESAISSRWQLLDVMKQEIPKKMLTGSGFGSRLEYKSSDPRVLQSSPDGWYSTYSFEWAWFDLLYKMGILGFVSYLLLMVFVAKDSFYLFIKKDKKKALFIVTSIFSLALVNFFTPYLNHPLGILALILLVLLARDIKVFKTVNIC